MTLIVFDFDGTLVDSQRVIIASVRTAFTHFDLEMPSDDAVRRIVGLPLVEGLARLAPALAPDQHEALAQYYREGFQRARATLVEQEALFPGVPEMLAALASAGFRLGIATGKSRRGLLGALERYGLMKLFETLQTGDVPPGKPHPAMLLRALEEADVPPHQAAMVGDTTYDITMAVAAKVLPVGVAWGYHPPEELRVAGAAHVVTDRTELPPLLGALFPTRWLSREPANRSSD